MLDQHDIESCYVTPRRVDVWCPPINRPADDARYPVIYLHDGQNLFDPASSFIGVDWGMGETMTRLQRECDGRSAMVVGIWNTPLRWREYMPSPAPGEQEPPSWVTKFNGQAGGEPLSDAYLKFIVTELKPFIDATYPTLADDKNTFIMGSSMGGLISLFALIQYPAVFGGAACLSTHWPAGENGLVDFLGSHLPPAGQHRLYFDFGTETLDAAYEPYQQRMDGWLKAAGYQMGRDWLTRKFAGAEHSERAWRARVAIPLRFLLEA